MNQYNLTEITTKDKLVHTGIYFEPKKKSKKAILWVHGLASTFYSNLPVIDELAAHCQERGVGIAVFNTRGHDLISFVKKIDKREAKGYSRFLEGAGAENFTDSLHDIDAGITFLEEKGFDEIYIVGHSTGANKVCYYAAQKRDARVAGVILLSPLSDRLTLSQTKSEQKETLDHMRKLVANGSGDELHVGHFYFPITPNRYLSLFSPGSHEDCFDYGEKTPKMTYFSKIHKPLLVVMGELDESADRPVEAIRTVFDKKTRSAEYTSVIIPDALHSFGGSETTLVQILVDWIQ